MIALEKQTGKPNPRLASRPKLRAELTPYFQAFNSLSRSRQFTDSSILPLRITEIEAYLRILGVPQGQAQLRWLRFIQAMDGVHMKWYSDRQSRKTKNK
ncbi:phage tail assembly chaperone [Oligella urethralis]|uniref:phage tail assembly chaperone n=1 Tax=Oligella urethralis TaxID=90245 RepID=UPI00065FDBEB